jgi:LacI family transcriptional regulator
MALRVYGILRSMGLNIPEDISIAGYDNYTLIAETLYPALTTVELPYRDMGRQAAELILDMIKQADHPNEPALMQGDVYWRSSVTDFFTTNVKMFHQ